MLKEHLDAANQVKAALKTVTKLAERGCAVGHIITALQDAQTRLQDRIREYRSAEPDDKRAAAPA